MTAWTKCSDQMPPDDDTELIFRSEFGKVTTTGSLFLQCIQISSIRRYEWTPYTEGLWEELNK